MPYKNLFKMFVASYIGLINSTVIYCSVASPNFVLSSGKRIVPNPIVLGAQTARSTQTAQNANELGEALTLKPKKNKKKKTPEEALRITLVRSLFNKKVDAETAAKYSKEVEEQKKQREKLEQELAREKQRVAAEKAYSSALKLKHERYLAKIKEARCCCFLWTCCYPRYEFEEQ